MAFVAKQPSALPIAILSLLVSKSQNLPETFGLSPNGLGYFETWVSSRMSQATGVFVQSSFPYTSDLSTGTLTGFGGFSFSLQKSNPIFGSSTKVQPQACQLLMIIKT